MCKNCEAGGKPIGATWWRESTASQLELSPGTQRRQSKELLESEGFEAPDEYAIGAVWHSLDTLECPEMQTLLSWMRNGKIHAVGVIVGIQQYGTGEVYEIPGLNPNRQGYPYRIA